jgi:hypothetical protein
MNTEQRSSVRAAAASFLDAAFAALTAEHVLPTARYHPHIRVGRDYFGGTIHGLSEHRELEQALVAEFPGRFSEEIPLMEREFADTYVFSLLEAAVARGTRFGEFNSASTASIETIDELVAVLESDSCEVACCRIVSHITTPGDPVEVAGVTVVPESRGVREFERLLGRWIPAGDSVFNRDPPYSHNPPNAMLVVSKSASSKEMYDVPPHVGAKLERFLLHARLLTGTTAQTFYEVAGPTSLVAPMSPYLSVPPSNLDSNVCRVLELDGTETDRFDAIARLIDGAAIAREGMATTSFDTALRKFHRSFAAGDPYDRVVDLATALEAALVSSKKDAEGLSLRLRSRAAALLATEADPAQAIFNDITQLYDLRSRLVHGGELTQRDLVKMVQKISTVPDDRAESMFGIGLGFALDRLRDLVRRAILARLGLAAGDDPLWPLRGDAPVDLQLSDDSKRVEWRQRWRWVLEDAGIGGASNAQHPAIDYLKAGSAQRR